MANVFASYSHAVERSLGRLREEYTFLQQRCKAEKLRFDARHVWRLYAEDLAAVPIGKAGRPRHDGTSKSPERVEAPATIADELLIWTRDTLVEGGPFESMNRAIEVGLRRLQREGPTTMGAPASPFNPEAWWKQYQEESRKRAQE